MKTLIVLKGTERVGKSESIKMAYRLLLDRYCYARRVNVSVEASLGSKETNARITANGIKIGIESMGDRPGHLRKSLRKFKGDGCEVIICAARSSFVDKIVKEVPEYKVDIIEKNHAGSSTAAQSLANQKTAKQIVEKVVGSLGK